MSQYNFEEFKAVGNRYNMGITLGKSERFYLGGTFCRKYNIHTTPFVKLLFDKNQNAVGFRFISEKTDGSIELKKLQDNSFYINAKPFLGMYDISTNKYLGRYHPIELIDNGIKTFVIELKEKKEIDTTSV